MTLPNKKPKTKNINHFGDMITDDFKNKINEHLGDMDKHDLITHKMYVNRENLNTKKKFKPNASLGNWYAGMEVYADDGDFPAKDSIVVMSSNCGDNGYVVPYDYATFDLGNEANDSYRGMILSLNDIEGQIEKIKKYASSKNANTKTIHKKIKELKVRKLHQIVMTSGPNPSMTMQPIAESGK